MSRNVDALAAIIQELDTADKDGDTLQLGTGPRSLATLLAARGVLAVDSLTDYDIDQLTAAENEAGDWTEAPDKVRAALRRCATGET